MEYTFRCQMFALIILASQISPATCTKPRFTESGEDYSLFCGEGEVLMPGQRYGTLENNLEIIISGEQKVTLHGKQWFNAFNCSSSNVDRCIDGMFICVREDFVKRFSSDSIDGIHLSSPNRNPSCYFLLIEYNGNGNLCGLHRRGQYGLCRSKCNYCWIQVYIGYRPTDIIDLYLQAIENNQHPDMDPGVAVGPVSESGEQVIGDVERLQRHKAFNFHGPIAFFFGQNDVKVSQNLVLNIIVSKSGKLSWTDAGCWRYFDIEGNGISERPSSTPRHSTLPLTSPTISTTNTEDTEEEILHGPPSDNDHDNDEMISDSAKVPAVLIGSIVGGIAGLIFVGLVVFLCAKYKCKCICQQRSKVSSSAPTSPPDEPQTGSDYTSPDMADVRNSTTSSIYTGLYTEIIPPPTYVNTASPYENE